MMGAMVVTTTAFAADFTVSPSQGWINPEEQVNKIVLTFDGEVAPNVDPKYGYYYVVDVEATLEDGTTYTNNLSATFEGNTITYETRSNTYLAIGQKKVFATGQTKGLAEGPLTFKIPEGAYTVNGEAGPAIELNYLLAAEKPVQSFDFTVSPTQGWINPEEQVNKIVLTFDGEVTPNVDPKYGYYYVVDVEATLEDGTAYTNNLSATFEGNTITYETRSNTYLAIGQKKVFATGQTKGLGEGPLTFKIPESSYCVNGEPGPAIELNYLLAAEAPASGANVTASPAEGVLAEPTKIFNFAFEGEIASANYDFVTVECMTTAGVKTFTGSEQYLSTEIFQSPNMTVTCAKNVEIGATGVFSADQTDPLAAGDVIFTIPAGTYTLNGEPGPEVKITYTLEAEPEPEAKTTITPEADSHNAALPEVVINFGEGKVPAWTSGSPSIYWNGLPGSNAAGKYFSLTNNAAGEGYKCAYSVRDNSLVITIPNEGITPGMYEFSISNYTVNEEAGEKLSFNIYVDEPNMENAQALEFTVDPATNAVQPNSIKNLVLTFAEGSNAVLVKPFKGGISYSLESAEDAVTNVDNWFNGYVFGDNRAEGNKVYFGNTSAIPNPNGKTNLWIHFSEGTFMVDGVYNEAVTLEYYLAAPEYFDYDAEPAAGSTTWSLDFMSLEFFDVDTEEMTFELAEDAKGQLKRNGAVMENYDVLLNVYENFLQMMVVDSATQEEAAVMEPGHYQVVIPAGSFFIDGLGNSEISLAYEIAYQEAEFTANPENGATVRGISSVELTFEDDVEIEALEAATYVMLGGAKINAEYVGEGNKLTVSLDTPVYASYNEETGNYSWTGEKNFIIPEGFFTIFGREAAQIELTYNFDYNVALPTFDFTVNPEEGTVEELEGEFILSFYNAKTRADISAGAMIEGVQLLRNGEAVENVEVMAGMMFGGDCYEMQVSLFDEEYNTLILTEEGTYTLVIPAGAFTSYGVENEEIRLTYKVDKSVNVEGLAADGVKVTVYDAQGRIILKDADAKELNSLKGLFIVNGKKQIRK